MIGIINYGMGNLMSVYNAVDYLGFDAEVFDSPNEIDKYDKIILPGVGTYQMCFDSLRDSGFVDVLNKCVLIDKKPILGICVGMQIMSTTGFENGKHSGLNWFDSEVVKIEPGIDELKVPHVGWNNVKFDSNNILFNKIKQDVDLYFVHSYHLKCSNAENRLAWTEYGQEVTAAIYRDNIWGVQFHPEKSQDHGLQILNNFIDLA
ncbi:MAG: imidazole glycerol phosphate synthase subunit HisH [Bacteroidota bacterium]|nr:imidazole glycerol phosphate synthase subunit HisH [Bacteroidota bacterium]